MPDLGYKIQDTVKSAGKIFSDREQQINRKLC